MTRLATAPATIGTLPLFLLAACGDGKRTTASTLRRVRVEVHLSNGIELGQTTPVDLAPGESVEIAPVSRGIHPALHDLEHTPGSGVVEVPV